MNTSIESTEKAEQKYFDPHVVFGNIIDLEINIELLK
jgi:hypothetical protein